MLTLEPPKKLGGRVAATRGFIRAGGGYEVRTDEKTSLDGVAGAARDRVDGVRRTGRAAGGEHLGFGALRSKHLAVTQEATT